ncbi:hypothetical protein V2H45_23755 [Tumidithrix elongata RA019]|uniref:Uncharacterized protein n=1 Tax=Tumidithrix elongata BACA0141 TaxID=2716417 RepID=A0AAW9Q3B6_9CYAN|nr:hypothetical protein [Tumidithrix elongata RA019]
MQPKNFNTFIFRSLMSLGIVVSNLSIGEVLPSSAQSSRIDEGIECIKKYRDFYYSREGGDLSSKDALAKAERTCAEQNDRPRRRYRDRDDDRQDSRDSVRVINSIASAGSYWVYQKPSDVSDSQMQSAGAAFYSSPQACSMHYSLCTTLGGVWLSQQQSLVIQNP